MNKLEKLSLPVKVSTVIGAFLCYYWFMQVFFQSDTLHRFVLLGPSILFTLFIGYLFFKKGIFEFKKSSYFLLFFLIGSIFTGLYNREVEIIAASLLFVIPFIAVNEKLITVHTELVNYLYVATIVVGIVAFHLGFNKYGYLPGHSYLMGVTPWWRISIFPTTSPTYTGFFSLLVYVYNLKGSTFKKNIIKLIAIYFLLLSGSRTAIMLFIGVLVFQYMRGYKILKYYLPYGLIAIPLLVLATDFIFSLSGNELAQEYLLRGKAYTSQEELSGFARFILWENLLSLFWESPLLGLGSYDFYEYFPFAPSHSESKWLSLLASNGIFTLGLFLFCVKRYYLAVKWKLDLEALAIMILIVSMFYYGSFYNPYNIIFFLNLFLIGKANKLTS